MKSMGDKIKHVVFYSYIEEVITERKPNMIKDKSFDELINQYYIVKHELKEKNLDNEQFLSECIELIMKVVCFDFKDTSPSQVVREESLGIKKFLQYQIDGNYDCDCADKLRDYFFEPYYYIEETYDNNRQYEMKMDNEQTLFCDSDTINSFSTLFNEFFRNFYIKEKYTLAWLPLYTGRYDVESMDIELSSDIREELKCIKGNYSSDTATKNRYRWLMDNFDTIFSDKFLNAHPLKKQCFEQFQLFAQLTHTIGNISFVPMGFNRIRGFGKLSRTRDFSDLFFQLFFPDADNQDAVAYMKDRSQNLWNANTDEYAKHMDEFLFQDYFDNGSVKPLFSTHSLYHVLPKTDEEFLECLRNINKRIVLRGLRILETPSKSFEIPRHADGTIDDANMRKLLKKAKGIDALIPKLF